MNERLHVIVRGRVQGVSFRYNTLLKVNEIGGITGWVRNCADGTVEVVAEGNRPSLERLLAWLHEGSLGSHVTEVEASWRSASEEFDLFRIQ